MKKPLCVVFSDAFAYGTYKLLGGLGEEYHLQKIIPGIGYSSNLHYLLFDGKTPDELGFFTDYTWKNAKAKKTGRIRRTCDEIETANNIVRAAARKITKLNDNIPFSERDFFYKNGKYKFLTENPTSVFGVQTDMAYEGNNYEACFDKAHKLLQKGSDSIVVVLEELDHLGHAVGFMGDPYIHSAKEILSRTDKLFHDFHAKYPEGICILISDHGMSDVVCGVNIVDGLKKRFGLPGEKYQMYMDSVYLRVWCDDDLYLKQIESYLQDIEILVMISDREAIRYGVTSKCFGDKIFRLKEGYVFYPNYFGLSVRGPVKGIHGYMEPTDSASGILVSNYEISKDDTIDAYHVFERVSAVVDHPRERN